MARQHVASVAIAGVLAAGASAAPEAPLPGGDTRQPSAAAATGLTATPVPLGTLGGEDSRAAAIDGNLAVGSAQTSRGAWHGFVIDLGALDPAMVDLGTLGGGSSSATDISGDLIVGVSRTAERSWHNFLYDLGDPAGAMVDLGPSSGGTEYGSPSGPFVEDGVVYGQTARRGHTRAFSYDTTSAQPEVRYYGTFGGPDSAAFGLDDGTLVGFAQDRSWEARAFLADLSAADPVVVGIGAPAGTRAYDVDAGVVVGNGWGAANAFHYDTGAPEPAGRRLGHLGGGSSSASAVEWPWVAGSSRLASGASHAAAFDLTTEPPAATDLGSLGGWSQAIDLDGTRLAGYATTRAGWLHPFAFDLGSSEKMTDLGPLPGHEWARPTEVDADLAVGWSFDRQTFVEEATAWRLAHTDRPLVRFARSGVTAEEDAGAVEIGVVREGDLSQPTSVGYTSFRAASRVARPRMDFTPVSGELSFAPGQSHALLSVPILQDALPESRERLGLQLLDPEDGHLGRLQTTALWIGPGDLVPDAMIRRLPPTGDHVGDDIVNPTGVGQTQRARSPRGGVTEFEARLCNDVEPRPVRSFAAPFVLSADPPTTGSRIQYVLGRRNVTRELQDPDGLSAVIGENRCRDLRMAVVVRRTAPAGSRHRAVVTLAWTGEGPAVDVVRGVVTVRAARD